MPTSLWFPSAFRKSEQPVESLCSIVQTESFAASSPPTPLHTSARR